MKARSKELLDRSVATRRGIGGWFGRVRGSS